MARKLIEVAPFLPLDAISTASKADKDKKTGTIRNIHKWFAPMPAPAVRALIFAALVDAPEDRAGQLSLLGLVERLVPSDGNAPDDATLEQAAAAIRASNGGAPPAVFDPFCGGGSTLIEAQRLGLQAIGSDLNPVPVLIARTLTELIPQVAGRPPLVGDPAELGALATGPHAGLLADVRYYAGRVHQRAWNAVGHLYPLEAEGATVLAWLWARTVCCSNPACGVAMPLLSNFWISKRPGAFRWYAPRVQGSRIAFSIGRTPDGPHLKDTISRAGATCVACGTHTGFPYIREQGRAGRMGVQLLAVAVAGDNGRDYLSADEANTPPAPESPTAPELRLSTNPRDIKTPNYGLVNVSDQFTTRQLCTLGAFADAIAEVPAIVTSDGGDPAYARTIASLLGLALGKLAQSNSTQVRWKIDSRNGAAKAEAAFGRHAMPMVWDFAETNPFGGSAGDWIGQVESLARGVAGLPRAPMPAIVSQGDARTAAGHLHSNVVIVTDPPYFDQIGYADLSDYFYVWHRRALRRVHPDLYGTIATPKDDELIASVYRNRGDKAAAAHRFIDGFRETFESLRSSTHPSAPLLIVYAHRQEEKSSTGSASTGWDAMLEAVLAAGLVVEGTLPIRGASSTRQISQNANSLASYIVLVCRPRPEGLRPATLSEFRDALRARLPGPVEALLATGESMVDLRQAAIGPGMEAFSQFNGVYDGSETITVRRALSIINEELGRLLDEQLGAVDDETRWAAAWYADTGYEAGEYDQARKLAAVYGLGVDGLVAAGIVEAGRGRVRLLLRAELPAAWDPREDGRVPAWEACQHLVRRIAEGETAAARLVSVLGARSAGLRELAQYLANVAIEKGWSDEAVAYDDIVTSWPRVEQLAAGMDLSDVQRQLSL